MKDKHEIVDNWLPRYTGVPLDQFGQHILLTNFGGYVDGFERMTGAEVVGLVVAVVVQLTPLQQGAWWQESGSAVLLSAALKELRPALPADFGRHLPS